MEVETSGGVVYEVEVPLTVHERLPPVGHPVELRTVQVVREDAVLLFGFLEPHERELFRRLLTASGVGVALAIILTPAGQDPREKDIDRLADDLRKFAAALFTRSDRNIVATSTIASDTTGGSWFDTCKRELAINCAPPVVSSASPTGIMAPSKMMIGQSMLA